MTRLTISLTILLWITAQNAAVFGSRTLPTNSLSFEDSKPQIEQYLDPTFESGKILFKTGSTTQDNLNYHLYSNSICFLNEKDEPFILVDLSNVLMVTYGNRTFIPIDNSNVAEVVRTFSDGSKLLLQRIAKTEKSSDNLGAYGTSTETAAITKFSSMQIDGLFIKLNVAEFNNVTLNNRFILLKNGKRTTISKLKSLRKVYKSKWDDIQAYAEQNNTNIKDIQELIDLLEFSTK